MHIFQNAEFCLSKLLKMFPLKKNQSKLSSQETRQFIKLIRENQSLTVICKQMNRSEPEIVDEIVILIRSGFLITKTHLAHLVGANDEILKYLKSNVTDEDILNSDNISEVKAKFDTNPHITEQMLILVLNYLKVRQFLCSIKVPYFDVDENQLINGSALLELKTVVKVNSQPYTQSQPKRENSQGSQKLNGSSSSSQKNQSTPIADLLGEDEDDFAAAIADYDSKTELKAKPLQSSQKPNQNIELKAFEVKQPAKMPVAQTKATATATRKRTAASSKYEIKYYSDSDSDSADNSQDPPKKRPLPQWMTTKKTTTTTTTNGQSNSIRKKNFF